jgi:hypothetical protein
MSGILEIMNVFKNSSITFHPKQLDTTLVPTPLSDNVYFGILDLEAIYAQITQEILEVLFMIDNSGSMCDSGFDGRTKMQHIIHTLTNIVNYFRENKISNVFITIYSFDDKICNIVERTNITEDNFTQIIQNINLIMPRGSTNIEKALQHVNSESKKLKEKYPHHRINHLFMTDGQITEGSSNISHLCSLIDPNILNIFIGFGIDHDARLLNSLTSLNSDYYFIDKIENAGYVYGAILHGIMYRFLQDLSIHITNGLIYNFKKNEWVASLTIGDFASENKKTYHVITNNQDLCSVEIFAKRIDDQSPVECSATIGPNLDSINYIYRQRTQQALYEANEFIYKNTTNSDDYFVEQDFDKQTTNQEQKKQIKTKLNDLFQELKNYMKDHNLQDDVFLRNLCDDLFISMKTFDTQYGAMYTTSRLSSQGHQRAYTTTNMPQIRRNKVRIGRICRANAMSFNTFKEEEDGEEEDEDCFDEEYQVSDSLRTPYRSSSQTQVMRSVSNTNNISEEN